jgi:hypothetical protein
MKIRKQVSISLIIFAILAILVIFSVYSSNNQLLEIDRKQQIIDEIEKGSFELYYLENDYFLHGGERLVKQWNSKYDELSGQIKELKITDPDQQAVFNRLSDSFTELQPTFSNFVAISESAQAKESIGTNQKFKGFAWSTLADQTQMMMFIVRTLTTGEKRGSGSPADKYPDYFTLACYAHNICPAQLFLHQPLCAQVHFNAP